MPPSVQFCQNFICNSNDKNDWLSGKKYIQGHPLKLLIKFNHIHTFSHIILKRNNDFPFFSWLLAPYFYYLIWSHSWFKVLWGPVVFYNHMWYRMSFLIVCALGKYNLCLNAYWFMIPRMMDVKFKCIFTGDIAYREDTKISYKMIILFNILWK